MSAVNRDCADIVAPEEMLSLRHRFSEMLADGRGAEVGPLDGNDPFQTRPCRSRTRGHGVNQMSLSP
jgi:hypothetical protein